VFQNEDFYEVAEDFANDEEGEVSVPPIPREYY